MSNEQLFTREQVEQNIEEMSRKFSRDKSGEITRNSQMRSWTSWRTVPQPIYKRTSKSSPRVFPSMKEKSGPTARFFNKEFHRELKRRTVDALQGTNAIYKGDDRLITTGRAATGLYEESQRFLETGEMKNNFSISWKGSDNRRSTRMLRAGQRTLRLGQ